jgi:hypothetical protein
MVPKYETTHTTMCDINITLDGITVPRTVLERADEVIE